MDSKQINNIKSITPIGWREWIYLPTYDDFPVKAKVDTGARTSALHATEIIEYDKGNNKWVSFILNQEENSTKIKTRLIEHKKIINSFGDTEIRPLIKLKIRLGKISWKTKVTLTTRNKMTYPMLLGRNSLLRKHLIYAHKSYLAGRMKNHNQ